MHTFRLEAIAIMDWKRLHEERAVDLPPELVGLRVRDLCVSVCVCACPGPPGTPNPDIDIVLY